MSQTTTVGDFSVTAVSALRASAACRSSSPCGRSHRCSSSRMWRSSSTISTDAGPSVWRDAEEGSARDGPVAFSRDAKPRRAGNPARRIDASAPHATPARAAVPVIARTPIQSTPAHERPSFRRSSSRNTSSAAVAWTRCRSRRAAAISSPGGSLARRVWSRIRDRTSACPLAAATSLVRIVPTSSGSLTASSRCSIDV